MFTLDNRPNKIKYNCPFCEHTKKFTRYIDTTTKEDIHASVGICDRINNCGYHKTPKQYFQENNMDCTTLNYMRSNNLPAAVLNKPFSTLDDKYANSSLKLLNYDNNNFFRFIVDCFGYDVALNVCKRYLVGNSNHWKGANIFWQKDINQKYRTGKVMLYDWVSGTRIKKPFNHVNWVHSILIKKNILTNFHSKQCFFGEHLLKLEINKTIAIVESEKTAIICSLYLPEYIWLACGSANGLNSEKCSCLKGRRIVLFPDLGMYKKWHDYSMKTNSILGLNFRVSNFLEERVTLEDLSEGYDLADYLLKRNSKGQAIHNTGISMEKHLLNRGSI